MLNIMEQLIFRPRLEKLRVGYAKWMLYPKQTNQHIYEFFAVQDKVATELSIVHLYFIVIV